MPCSAQMVSLSDLQTHHRPPRGRQFRTLFGGEHRPVRPHGKSWLIPSVVRGWYGDNALNFDEDEATARFVAASFTDVPRLAAALQRAETVLASMENLVEHSAEMRSDFPQATAALRAAAASPSRNPTRTTSIHRQ